MPRLKNNETQIKTMNWQTRIEETVVVVTKKTNTPEAHQLWPPKWKILPWVVTTLALSILQLRHPLARIWQSFQVHSLNESSTSRHTNCLWIYWFLSVPIVTTTTIFFFDGMRKTKKNTWWHSAPTLTSSLHKKGMWMTAHTYIQTNMHVFISTFDRIFQKKKNQLQRTH